MKIGIIGCGVMGGAIAGFLHGEELIGYDTNYEKVEALGIRVVDSVEALVI
ncbi:MAG TPA: NAD(P)-dependent oxidoreductase, partial [Rikenellaceae bacterium]|nr:NAD(P)-dependent oxidoreductase [Rikenellaceae bacterium]